MAIVYLAENLATLQKLKDYHYETCKKYHITEEYFCEQEDLLLRQIGFIVNKKALDKNAYYDIKVDTDKIRDCVEEILSMMDNLS